MSQDRGEENIQKFEAWIASQTNADFKNISYRGSLKRSAIAQGTGFAKSVLQQNPAVKKRLEQLEDELRRKGILPPKTEQRLTEEKENKPKHYDASQNARRWDRNRLQKLEQENLELKTKLRRYEELSEVIAEMGIRL